MAVITATLTNDNGSLQLPTLEVPLTQGIIENATDVETLDGNLYTDFVLQKRKWTLSYNTVKEDDYVAIKAYYDQQFIDYENPLFSLSAPLSISNVPVRMYMNDKDVFNNCGDVEGVVLTFRETRAS